MLVELQIENFILMKKDRISFIRGLNTVSGASGAGKTILVKALRLLKGERAASGLIGSFGNKAIVEGSFKMDPALLKTLLESTAPQAADENGELVACRTIDASGDNRCYLNGRGMTLQAFRKIMEPIMEISGQEGFSSLSRPAERTGILDRYGGCEDLGRNFAVALYEARKTKEALEKVRCGAAERRDRLDLLTYQINEIRKLDLDPGETARLEEEHRILGSRKEIGDALGTGRSDLYEGEDSIADRLGILVKTLESLPRRDGDKIESCIESLESALVGLEEAAFTMRDIHESLHADPDRLESLEQRLSEIQRILRRYGPTESDLFEFLEKIEEEHSRITTGSESVEELEAELEKKTKDLLLLGRKLTKIRKEAGRKLARKVDDTLARLLMKDVAFSITVDDPDERDILATATSLGPGPVRFMASTNPGTAAAPVDAIASGGERSRILLALLSTLGECSGTPILVFDEIDENVGNRLGGVVGDLLVSLGLSRQVISVTHLPAIAAKGTLHHKVSKSSFGKKTLVETAELTGEERVRELAEMIAGPSPAGSAVQEARRLLGRNGKERGRKEAAL